MVLYISIGCLAFFLMLISDLNKIRQINGFINLSFIAGILLLLYSSLMIILNDLNNQNWALWKWGTGILASLFLILLIYSLFGAIPFKKTYIEAKKNTVVKTGMYALCRHPGVIWFFFFYFFLALTLSSSLLLLAALVWTSLNIIYVVIQDNWIFPITLAGYEAYKQEVPFLLPDKNSWQNFAQYYRRKTKWV